MAYNDTQDDDQNGTYGADDQESSDTSQDTDNSYTNASDDQASASDDQASADPQQAVENATPHEQQAHRGLLGAAIDQLQSRGIDVNALAERAGISSADVNELSNADLGQLTSYITQQHPEVLQQVAQHFPAAQGILGTIMGNSGEGGGLGSLLGKFLGH